MDWNITLDQLYTSHLLLDSDFEICGDTLSIRKTNTQSILQEESKFTCEELVFTHSYKLDET